MLSNSNCYYVVVSGNIGVGKTSLCHLLQAQLRWDICIEGESSNPYIEDFYKDMKRWGFHSQIYFLCHRFREVRKMIDKGIPFIQDRSMYEDACIFVRNLLDNGHLSQRDYNTYQWVYESLISYLRPPDLVIYLKASLSTLVSQIQARSRMYERTVPLDYLAKLNDLYEQWYTNYPYRKKTISVDNIDFVHNHRQKQELLGEIISSFNNFFNVN